MWAIAYKECGASSSGKNRRTGKPQTLLLDAEGRRYGFHERKSRAPTLQTTEIHKLASGTKPDTISVLMSNRPRTKIIRAVTSTLVQQARR